MPQKLKSPDPHFVQVDIAFAKEYGLNEAILAGKMLRLQENFTGAIDDYGVKWIRLTLEEWCNELPFFSDMTIRRTIDSLEYKQIFLSTTFSGRSKWYRLNPDFVEDIPQKTTVQNEQIHYDKCAKRTDTTVQNEQLPISSPKSKSDKVNKEYSLQQKLFIVLAELCHINLKIATPKQIGQLDQASKALSRIVTDLDLFKIKFTTYWTHLDWRGKQGQSPTPPIIRECYGDFCHWLSNGEQLLAYKNGASQNGHQTQKEGSEQARKAQIGNSPAALEHSNQQSDNLGRVSKGLRDALRARARTGGGAT